MRIVHVDVLTQVFCFPEDTRRRIVHKEFPLFRNFVTLEISRKFAISEIWLVAVGELKGYFTSNGFPRDFHHL